MLDEGRVEILSAAFALGWARTERGVPCPVVALLDGKVIGHAEANLDRPDLAAASADGPHVARAFAIVFASLVPEGREHAVEILAVSVGRVLPPAARLRIERAPPLQVFVLGSPRSGTSQLAATLAEVLGLPWMGEGHGMPRFVQAAEALGGSPEGGEVARFLAQQHGRGLAIEAARRVFYYLHGSASFLDKTPGVPMIAAAPFLPECFPAARVIYLRRNGISNVLSRMAKFGGSFEEHCSDWAMALKTWARVRDALPHYLELEQEDMLAAPERVGAQVADYLGVPDQGPAMGQSLRGGLREHTGAGAAIRTLAETGWSEAEQNTFRRRCGPTMVMFGYSNYLDPQRSSSCNSEQWL